MQVAYVARMVLDHIDFNNAQERAMLILDKSKGKPEIADFNAYIFRQLQGNINPKIPLDIAHRLSHEMMGLQAVDLLMKLKFDANHHLIMALFGYHTIHMLRSF